MKRSDVLIGLHLKLGPALKIYGQVKKLQIRQSDPALLWPWRRWRLCFAQI